MQEQQLSKCIKQRKTDTILRRLSVDMDVPLQVLPCFDLDLY